MTSRVRVHLEATDEVRATLAAQEISVEGYTAGGTGAQPPASAAFTAVVPTDVDAVDAVRQALRRWGDVPVEPID